MEHIRSVTREFLTGDKAVLHLEARSGSVVVEGRQGDRIAVDATLHIWTDIGAEADEAAEAVARGMEQDAHRVIVRAPSLRQREGWAAIFGHHGARIEYRVLVPLRTAVRVLSRSGTVQIAGTQGVVHTEALSGRLAVENIEGDVTAISRSGKVRIRNVSGKLQAEARSGSIEIEDIGAGARVTASSGALSMANIRGEVQARSRAGSVRYRGRVTADMNIEAHAGSITLAVDPQYPFFVDAESTAGSVHSDLPPRRNGSGPEGGGPKVRLRTHAGSIRLTRD